MKTRKFLSLLLVLALVLSVGVASAYALEYPGTSSGSCPYKSASVNISVNWFGDDTATSTITACSCNPVDNYLMASIKIQYKIGSKVYDDPSNGTFYYNSDYNTTKQTISITAGEITYAKGWFRATCKSNGKEKVADFYLEDQP